jgi:hypothetical protein
LYVIHRRASPNKIRDINIAIAYHNTGRSLKDVAKEYGMSSGNVERIHHSLVRHIARCVGLDDIYFHTEKKNHSEQMAVYLQEYKYLLEGKELKTEITLNDEDGQEALVVSSCHENEFVNIRLLDECTSCEISIEDLKAALRKLSAK